MAVTAFNFGNAARTLLNGEWNWNTSNIRLMLLNSTYVFNQDTQVYLSDINTATMEVSGTGYTAGGASVPTRTLLAYDATNNRATADASDVEWTGSTITANYGVIYASTGTPATSPLIAYVNFDGAMTTSNGTFRVQWAETGIMSISTSA